MNCDVIETMPNELYHPLWTRFNCRYSVIGLSAAVLGGFVCIVIALG